MLGNKCAGQHNLKTVHFKETLASSNFWHGHEQYVCFLQCYLPQDSGGKLFCNDGGGVQLQALLEGALGQQAADFSDFIFKKR